ncbi:MAG: ABC transporter ATP-binding protein [Cohaesibacteraceae bacterium]|nr:ABC transporter ATP-binding protein [Cohaesibacteraceae bacterium]
MALDNTPLLDVQDIAISVKTPTGLKEVVHGFSYSVAAGETLCIAGESGSGKSITSLALMGLLPPESALVTRGKAFLDGEDLLQMPQSRLQHVRGNDIAMIFQEPMTSLNPVMNIGAQMREVLRVHLQLDGKSANRQIIDLFDAVRLSEAKKRLEQYPHELSGGMRQRVMIAMALLCKPRVLIADEPTTALDVTIQAQILTLLKELQKDFGTALVLITHDMGVVAEVADRVLIVNEGSMVEQGAVRQIFHEPSKPYTQKLLSDLPRIGSMTGTIPVQLKKTSKTRPGTEPDPVLQVKNLTVRFDITGGFLRRPVKRVHAVEDISFDLYPGETLSLVGESGCGKSTTGRALLNLIDWQGSIVIDGQDARHGFATDMLAVRRKIQMIFQDPYSSLNPRMCVGDLVAEPLLVHGVGDKSGHHDKVEALFERVGLAPEYMSRHPHEFSGGQRQRICIARALALNPKIIVADESVSALDVTVQAQVLELLKELQDDLGIAYLFISHDMAVVEQVSHRVAVMYMGRIVEIGSRQAIFENPTHPYTRSLLDAVPIADPDQRRERKGLLTSDIPSPVKPLDYVPEKLTMQSVGEGHWVAGQS